jgi:hypothetical protein
MQRGNKSRHTCFLGAERELMYTQKFPPRKEQQKKESVLFIHFAYEWALSCSSSLCSASWGANTHSHM